MRIMKNAPRLIDEMTEEELRAERERCVNRYRAAKESFEFVTAGEYKERIQALDNARQRLTQAG